jgi:hypothetical protein
VSAWCVYDGSHLSVLTHAPTRYAPHGSNEVGKTAVARVLVVRAEEGLAVLEPCLAEERVVRCSLSFDSSVFGHSPLQHIVLSIITSW